MKKNEYQINILIVDDHLLITKGIEQMLGNSPIIGLIKSASNAKDAFQILNNEGDRIHIVLMDIKMPGMDGIDATKVISKKYPDINTIMLTMFSDKESIVNSFTSGAKAYLLKDSPPEKLLSVIDNVYKRGAYVTSYQLGILTSSINALTIEKYKKVDADLSERELSILQLMAKEYTTREISQELFLGIRTIDANKSSLLEKTGAKNSVGLMMYAMQNGLIQI